jgi:hypothetical protein
LNRTISVSLSRSTQKNTLLAVLLMATSLMVLTAHTAFATTLTPGDRYQSGYNHGFADQKAEEPNFCSSDHTQQYCDGYRQGWDDAQAGHYPGWNKSDDDN